MDADQPATGPERPGQRPGYCQIGRQALPICHLASNTS
jgi:hypothetical protein